ncbi:MAG: hypothetical protein ACI8TP_001773 [Acidimicrobiales bacterium]|jgi:hypothetical protein
MSDQSPLPPAGWLYAEGDPPGTQRYLDGSAWQGGPQAAPAPSSSRPPGPGAPSGAGYGSGSTPQSG